MKILREISFGSTLDIKYQKKEMKIIESINNILMKNRTKSVIMRDLYSPTQVKGDSEEKNMRIFNLNLSSFQLSRCIANEISLEIIQISRKFENLDIQENSSLE